MKTAVEWLINQFLEVNVDSITNENMYIKIPTKALKQAKEMEREQMCKFASDYVETQCNASFNGSVSVDITTEEYYNLTFKSE